MDSQQIKHIQVIQQNEGRSWTGLQVQFTQRPGVGNIHTNRKFVKMSEYFKVSVCVSKATRLPRSKAYDEQKSFLVDLHDPGNLNPNLPVIALV